ncbi:hypothetical protein L596_014005 [Steinernema carpocapsae]|uniref:Uncharacterized protein n=1 Tax=Steinernema carpocapsae TaxID=34508 RepID=A0A4V6A2N6_STECR|nr:hypothetical protein L596_014005 [Steinernema carpocapsae]
MENDIQSAVLRATQAVGMYGGFPRPVPSGYTPFEAFIVTNSSDTTNRKPGTYFGELGAITIQRTVLNQDGGTPVVKESLILGPLDPRQRPTRQYEGAVDERRRPDVHVPLHWIPRPLFGSDHRSLRL